MISSIKRILLPVSWKQGCIFILVAAALHACISLPPVLPYQPFASAPLFDPQADSIRLELNPLDPNRNIWIFPDAKSFSIQSRKYYLISARVKSGAPFLVFLKPEHGHIDKFLYAGTDPGANALNGVIQNNAADSEGTLEIHALRKGAVPSLENIRVSELNPIYYPIRDVLEFIRVALRVVIFIYMGWIGVSLSFRFRANRSFALIPLGERQWLLILLAVAAFLRLYDLGLLTPFCDEITDLCPPFASSLRLQFGEGKFLGYWLIKPFALLGHFLFADRLWAARAAIAVLGVLNVALIYNWIRSLWNREAGLWAAGLWCLLPFVVLHDRLALFDAIVVSFVLLLLSAFSKNEPDAPWKSGLALGAGMLTKMTALFSIPWLLPLLWVSKEKPGIKDLWKCILVVGYAGLQVGLLMLPWFSYFLDYSRSHAVQLSQMDAGPKAIFTNLMHRPFPNLLRIKGYILVYGGMATLVLAPLLALQIFRKPHRIKWALAACCLLSLLIHLFVFDDWFARYFLFHLLPFFALAGILLAEIRKDFFSDRSGSFFSGQRLYAGVIFLVLACTLLQWISWNARLLFSPFNLSVKNSDAAQYINPTGNTLAESTARDVLLVDRLSKPRPLTVFTNHESFKNLTEWKYRFSSGIQWELVIDLKAGTSIQFDPVELSERIHRVEGRRVIVALIGPIDPVLHRQFLELVPNLKILADFSNENGLPLTMWVLDEKVPTRTP